VEPPPTHHIGNAELRSVRTMGQPPGRRMQAQGRSTRSRPVGPVAARPRPVDGSSLAQRALDWLVVEMCCHGACFTGCIAPLPVACFWCSRPHLVPLSPHSRAAGPGGKHAFAGGSSLWLIPSPSRMQQAMACQPEAPPPGPRPPLLGLDEQARVCQREFIHDGAPSSKARFQAQSLEAVGDDGRGLAAIQGARTSLRLGKKARPIAVGPSTCRPHWH